MNKSFPGFTVLVERALRAACLLGVVTLAACGGGTDEADAPAATQTSVSDDFGARRPLTPGGIVLSEKDSSTQPRAILAGATDSAMRTRGIVLSEKADAPDAEVVEADAAEIEADTNDDAAAE